VSVPVQVFRKAHGPRVVARSDGAVVDLDARHLRTVSKPDAVTTQGVPS
jgi:hypothetical protein